MNSLKTLDMVTIIPLSKSIDKIMEGERHYIPVENVCKNYRKKLASGKHEDELCESFVEEFANVADHKYAKQRLYELTYMLEQQKTNLEYANNLRKLSRGVFSYAYPNIENAVLNYMCEKNTETRDNARRVLDLFSTSKEVSAILETMKFEEYEQRGGKTLVNVTLNEEEVAPKTYTEAEMNAIVESRIAEEKVKAEQQKPEEKRTMSSIDTNLGLHNAIKNIMEQCSSNENVMKVCETYMNALNSGKSEVRLYEDFISAISPWNYMSAVDTQVSTVKDRASKYKQNIDLKKILEVMKETGSYYIVPLIEDAVADYCANKNLNTVNLLKHRLRPFEYDNFVRDILTIISGDQSIRSQVYLGESIENVNNYVKTEKVFSPIHLLKENDCVFNVKGSYFVKHANSITKMAEKDVKKLPADFTNLCNIINSGNVVINEGLNTISVYDDAHSAVISESSITIDKKEVDSKELAALAKSSVMMRDGMENFYNTIAIVNENFNNIAYIDFVKHIEQKSGHKSADVFRLKNNLYINTVNESLGKSTFYRNVNPIQLQHHLNEHMEINVAPLFEDVLPNQKQVKEDIEKTRKEYKDYLDELYKKRKTLEEMSLDADNTEEIENAIKDAIKDVEDELKSTNKEYDEYKKNTDKFLTGDGEDEKDSENTDDTDKNTDSKTDNDNEPDDTDKESPEDMEEPIEPDETENVDFTDDDTNFEDVPEYDSTFDAISETPENEDGFKIMKVSFNKNVKTNKVSNHGEVFIVIPTVDANGDVHDDTKKVTFYIDQSTNNVIINNEYMPLDMYKAIEKAVKDDPNTGSVEYDTDIPADKTVSYDTDMDSTFDDMFNDDNDNTTSVTVNDEPEGNKFTDDSSVDDIPSVDTNIDNNTDTDNNDDTSSNDSSISTPTAPAKRSPYPVHIALNKNDLRPLKGEEFEAALEGMNINCSVIEGVDDGMCFTCECNDDVRKLRRYFSKVKGFNEERFNNFFPELKDCGVDVAEGVKINKVYSINESVILKKGGKGGVTVMLPNNKELRDIFKTSSTNGRLLKVVTENYDETREVYEKLSEYAYNTKDVSEDINGFLECNKVDFKDIYESYRCYNVTVPNSNMLRQKLSAKGIHTEVVNENLCASIRPSDNKAAVKVFKKFYGNNMPESVSGFINDINEGVVITVKDDHTGKTVTIDTSAIDGEKDMPKDNDEPTDFESSFNNTTFNPEDSILYKDTDEEDKDEKDEKDKKDEKKDNKDEKKDNPEEQNEAEETPEVKDEEKPKAKKKFKFKAVKKASKNESVESEPASALNESASNSVNESHDITVYDNVYLKDGRKGQVLALYHDNYVVSVSGHTELFKESELTSVVEKPKTVLPYKFDMSTLKAIFEQMVPCGMFMNNIQITPSDCYVKFSDYAAAGDEDNVNIIIEGESTEATKKYIRVLESIDSFANISDYIEKSIDGMNESVLVNKSDMNNPVLNDVRCLIHPNTENCKLVKVAKSDISAE